MLIPVDYLIIGFLLIATLLFSVFLRPKLSRFSQILFYAIITFIVVSYALHVNRGMIIGGPMRQFFDFTHGEFNHTATMSSVLLFSAGAMALLQSFAPKKTWWNFPLWIYIASLFLFLATDEYFLIHETLGYWEEIYISVAAVTTLTLGAIVWRYYTRIQFVALAIVVCGMGISAVGGVVLENVVGDLCFGLVPMSYCGSLPILEEIFEISGYATAFIGMMLFVENAYEENRWRRLHLTYSALAILWASWLIFTYWILPSVELRFIANPIDANFDKGRMILRGYTVTPSHVVAGDDVTIRLYWYSEVEPLVQYGYTVNIVHPDTGESIIRINKVIDAPPTDDWFGGTVHWTELDIEIPEDIDTPISPLIIPTIWREESEGVYLTYTAEESSVRVLNSGPVMTALPILSDNDSDSESTYDFANGIGLSSTLSEEEDNSFTFDFSWTTSEAISANVAQILHLVPDDGGDILVFDQIPFGNTFPSSTWVSGMNEVDTITLNIADDVVSGNYTLYTGLYDVVTGERININNDVAVNNLVAIAEITLGSDNDE